jgi:hypothetical protein
MNQGGVKIVEIVITMDQLLTSIMEELVHTLLLTMMFKFLKKLELHNHSDSMNQDGDGTLEIATTMVHLLTSTTVEHLHMLSPMMISKLNNQ